ncbi:MAG: ABC transporter permease [Lachnospiraceae bacterium]|nr:ABC transporter permease [Lachnospiraceae bacterium]
MERIKKIFRNPASDLLFVLGLVISCIILLNIANLVTSISVEDKTVNSYKYASRMVISETLNDEISLSLINYLDNFDKGNVYLTKSVHIDNQSDGKFAYVLMENNEELSFEFKEGSYHKDLKYSNAVIIGESLEEYVIKQEGKSYIYFDNEKYSVIGILENKMSSGIDQSIYILWDSIDSQIKQTWFTYDFISGQIYFESNMYDATVMDEFRNKVSTYGVNVDVIGNDKKVSGDMNQWYKMLNEILLGVALAFSIITCFSVSYLWLLNRRKEFAIRIAYGYNRWQIFKLLFIDIFRLIIPAFIVSLLIQFVYGCALNKTVLLGEMFWLRISIIFVGIVTIVLINAFYLVTKMKKFSAIMINEEK